MKHHLEIEPAHARLERMGGRRGQRYVLLDSEGVQAGRADDLV